MIVYDGPFDKKTKPSVAQGNFWLELSQATLIGGVCSAIMVKRFTRGFGLSLEERNALMWKVGIMGGLVLAPFILNGEWFLYRLKKGLEKY